MAKDISIKLNFDSNGKVVMGQLTVSAKELQCAVKAIQKQTKDSFKDIITCTGAAVNAFQGAISGISALAQPYMEFDQAMRTANTMAGKGAKEFEQLKDQVKALSKEVPVARDALANGLYQVISNGVPESNWMSFLEQSAKSSVGGVADLGEVVKVTSTVIKNYGLSWEDAGQIQDMIQLTAKNGVTSFEQLAQALPRVTTNAAKLGISTSELMATFSTLTGVTGNTSEVSTQLAAVLTALVKPSSEATKMAEKMGITFNAASIKSAGGLQNFLVTLDQAVQNYASTSGMLADEVYGKLFGSAESLRALGALTGQLSDKYQENVAAMQGAAGTIDAAFEEMAESSQSTAQQLQNMFSSVTDAIGKSAAVMYPYIQYIASLSMAISGLTAVGTMCKSMWGVLTAATTRYNVVQKISIALGKSARAILSVMPKTIRNVALGMQMLATSSRTAAIAVNVLKVAIKSLMAATAIGLIIVAVTSIIDAFTNKVDDASDALDESKKEFDDWKKSLTDISEATGQAAAKEIKTLDQLYKTATDETKSRKERVKAANELKRTYKDAFENFKTEAILAGKAKLAYDELTGSILKAARARAAQDKLDELYGQKLTIEDQLSNARTDAENKRAAVDTAKENKKRIDASVDQRAKTNRNKTLKVNGEDISVYETGISYKQTVSANKKVKEAEDASKVADATLKDLEKRDKAIDEAINVMAKKVYDANQEVLKTGSSNPDPDADDKSKQTLKQRLEAQLSAAKERYTVAAIHGNESEAASIKTVIDSLRQQKSQIELIEKQAERPATLTTLEDINAEIQYQQTLRSRASKENISAIDAEIKRLEKKRQAIEDASADIKNVDQIKTYDDLNTALQYHQQKMQTASETERIEIQKTINELEKLREAWNNALGELKAPGDIGSLNTLDELSQALSYYQNKLETASADEMYGIQQTINQIQKKQSIIKRGIRLADMQGEVDEINGLSGKEYSVKIKSMGFDELTAKIKELKTMLNDTKNPMSDSMKDNARQLIGEYESMRRAGIKSFDTMQRGWGVTRGLGESIGGMVTNIKDSNNAWEKGTAIVESAMSIYEGVMQVIQLVNMITTALNMTKQQEATEAKETAAAEVAGAIATIGAKQAESAATKSDTTEKMANAASGIFSAHSSIPFVGIAIAGALVATMLGIMAGMPKFADGGIAYGPTLGLFGEYPGAGNNPEVVAPLNKLRTLIQPAGMGDGRVVFDIEGTKLRGVLKRVEKLSSRS